MLLHQLPVDVKDIPHLLFSLLLCSVCGVSLLPEKLFRSQKRLGGLGLPPYNVTPLIQFEGKVSPTPYPLGVHGVDYSLRSRPDSQPFMQLAAPPHSDPGNLRNKPFKVFSLPPQEALRYEEGEVGISVSSLLDSVVEEILNLLPYGVGVSSEDYATLDGRVICQFRFQDDLGVPLREIFRFLYCDA